MAWQRYHGAMRLDPISLRLFVAAMEEGAIARAAEREHLAASAASRRLADLERQLGVALFARSNRGTEPTAAAYALLDLARGVLNELDGIATQMRGFGAHFQPQPPASGLEIQRGRSLAGRPGRLQVVGPLAHEGAVARAHQAFGVGRRRVGEVIDIAAAASTPVERPALRIQAATRAWRAVRFHGIAP